MPAPKPKSAFDKLLAQSTMLVSDMKMLRIEFADFDLRRGSEDERWIIEQRLHALQSRSFLISDQLREVYKAFRETKEQPPIEFGNLRLSKGDA